ncbi:MAG TPA: DUF1631 family protein [Ottowia sp.]|uniref:DUF1631 family protein n=1 Tax=Ottowia sp. TaxID=1898956 RepID=UPI002BD78497|nr:DUF1631 family protein [Ottowia sp.]HMN20763.1 DUF1631 family protein [Ottowia sp.]
MSLAANTGPLVERSKREALLQASGMIERSLQAASSELQEAQRTSRSVARRMQLEDALAALDRHAATVRSEFPRRLLAGIDAILHATPPDEAPRKAPGGSSMLALLDEGEVSRFVEASRLQQNAMPLVERTLSQLDSLMSSALGLPEVRADRNPFRPEILCGALMEVLQDLPESDDVRSLWVRYLSTPFAGEMRALYEALVEMLEAQGVEEARYRVRLTAGGAAPHGAASRTTGAGGEAGPGPTGGGFGGVAPGGRGSPGGAGPAGASQADAGRAARGETAAGRGFVPRVHELSRSSPAVEAAVVHDFLYQPQWFETYDEPLPEGYYEAVEAEQARLAQQAEPAYDDSMRAFELERLRAQDVVERSPRAVRVDAALAPAQWGELASAQARTRARMQLKARAQRISQVLGLDAVRLLLEQVAGDGRVLAPVREAFVALEPALLRLALDQPRFFAEDAHPARVLMEAVAQRSFKYNDEFAPEFEQFMAPLRGAVRKLAQAAEVSAEDFRTQHEALETGWKAADEGGEAARAQVLNSMQFAQERQALADRVALDFSLRPDLVGVPAVVADFLYQDWSLVIAHAQLTHPGTGSRLDPGGYLAVVSDLLWSVNREQAIKQPARLFEVVPGLLGTLRRGLEMLGKEPAETQSFFDVLMHYHDPVLRLRRVRSAQDVEASGHERARSLLDALPSVRSDVLTERPVPRKAEQPWLARIEREAAGFADVEPVEETGASGLGEETGDGAPSSVSGLSPVAAAPDLTESATPGASGGAAAAGAAAGGAEDDLAARVRAEVARMRVGDWVDLYVHKSWRRAQLSWTSDNGSLFMFVSQGGRAHGMTRRTCEKLLRQRHLRPVDMDPVVDRALRELARAGAARRAGNPAPHVAG